MADDASVPSRRTLSMRIKERCANLLIDVSALISAGLYIRRELAAMMQSQSAIFLKQDRRRARARITAIARARRLLNAGW